MIVVLIAVHLIVVIIVKVAVAAIKTAAINYLLENSPKAAYSSILNFYNKYICRLCFLHC